MITRILFTVLISTFAASAFANPEEKSEAAHDAKAEAAPEPAIVVTSEGLVERCILPLVVTTVDGEELEDDSGRYELEAGDHSFSGYAQGDFSACETIATAGIGADRIVAKGSATVNVPAGKEYFLGMDVRKTDPATWRIVTWKINH